MRAYGRKSHRLELAVDPLMHAAIQVKAKKLAGGGDPKMFRSEAARQLISAGVDATPGLEAEAEALVREAEA